MDGFEILLNAIIKTFKIKLEPKEIEETISQAKVLIPATFAKFTELTEKIDAQTAELKALRAELESQREWMKKS